MMLKNTLKPTLRRLLKDKAFLLVSILSLSAGLLCFLFIFKYVLHELSYDRFHKDADRIYRMEMEIFSEDGVRNRYAYPVGNRSVDWLHLVPEIEMESWFSIFYGDMLINVGEDRYTETGIIAANNSFFELFSFNLIRGNPKSALAAPNNVVVSRTIAQKYFDTTDVLGKTFRLSNLTGKEALLTISGVVEDIPEHSHFSFDIVTSTAVYKQLYGPNKAYTYIKIPKNTAYSQVEKKLNALYNDISQEESFILNFHLQPITDIHLHSSSIGELSANSNAAYVTLFAVIAFIILGIACINFAMLAAARSAKRAREAGMRKVFGAGKNSLITAILAESLLLAFVGLILAVLLAWLLLPHFNLLSGKHFIFGGLFSPSFLLLMTGVTVVTGTIAGLYPAFLLAGNHAKILLQENMFRGCRRGLLWKGIVVIQLAISIGLISATSIIHKQIDFIFTQDPGFDKEQIIKFSNYFYRGNQKEIFMNQLKQHSDIEYATVSLSVPGVSETIGPAGRSSVEAEGMSGSSTFEVNVVDHHFFDTYGIPVIDGRNFSEELASDSTQAFILNETSVNTLGWTEPIGKKINAYGREGYVIGVVKDFHFTSFHNEIAPMVFLIYDYFYTTISVKIRSAQNLTETLSYVEETWDELLPGIPFRYEFVDEQFAAVYETEEQAQSLIFSFSVLAIIIAILGLISFTSYMIRQKTREIGIRKVLGATLYDILKLFYTGYAKLLLIAVLIAIPAGYLWMTNWLENFAYRTEIGFETFLIPVVLAILILLLSVSRQVVKGALQNPADVIRAE